MSWKNHHNSPPLVTDHDRKKVGRSKAGRDTITLDAFFDDLDPDLAADLKAVSTDRAPAHATSVVRVLDRTSRPTTHTHAGRP